MLVLEPSRRYTIPRVKQHEWMLMDGGGGKSCPPSPTIGHKAKVGQYNEQILRIMQSLGIDQQKTMEVSCAALQLCNMINLLFSHGRVRIRDAVRFISQDALVLCLGFRTLCSLILRSEDTL